MNKTKIEFCDATWNPVSGCRFTCTFCYARKIANHYKLYGGSFEPQFHPDKLDEPFKEKKPMVIFVSDMGDIFSPGMKKEWIEKVKAAADKAPWHTYLWLTKNPNGRNSYDKSWVRPNWWLGATITGPGDAFQREVCVDNANIWYSYEPLLGLPEEGYAWNADQIIIGAATNCGLPYTPAWGKEMARRYPEAKVFVKSNGMWKGAPRKLCWTVTKLVEKARELTKPVRLSKGKKRDMGVAGTSIRG